MLDDEPDHKHILTCSRSDSIVAGAKQLASEIPSAGDVVSLEWDGKYVPPRRGGGGGDPSHHPLSNGSSTIGGVVRLRQSLDVALRHPIFGPLLLLFVVLMLAFVFVHTIEHGVEGLLFSCVMLVAAALRLVVVVGRICRTRSLPIRHTGRAPPVLAARFHPASNSPPGDLLAPLRR
jgi:hypothetical protein